MIAHGCEQCVLKPYTADLSDLPECINSLRETGKFQSPGMFEFLLDDIYECSKCGAHWQYQWVPREDYYGESPVDDAFLEIFSPEFDYDHLLALVVKMATVDRGLTSTISQRFHDVCSLPLQIMHDKLVASFSNDIDWRAAAILSNAFMFLVGKAIKQGELPEEMPPIETPKEDIEEMIIQLEVDSHKRANNPAPKRAREADAALKLHQGFRPIYDLLTAPGLFVDASEWDKKTTQEAMLIGIAGYTYRMGGSRITEPKIWMPDKEWRWLEKNYATLRDGKTPGTLWRGVQSISFYVRAPGLLLGIGSLLITLVSAGMYSLTDLPRGDLSGVVPVAILHGLMVFVLTRAVKAKVSTLPVAFILLPVLAIGPVLLGHLLRYQEAPSLAYTQVHNDIQGPYPEFMKELDADSLFPHFVKFHTGQAGNGFVDYLRLYATQGFEGFARGHIKRLGIWVWNAWLMHCVAYLLVSAVGFLGLRLPEDE